MEEFKYLKDKKDILKKSQSFFTSIKDQYVYREKHMWFFKMASGLALFFQILLVFTIIPLTPGMLNSMDYFDFERFYFFGINVYWGNFFIKWIVCIVISTILFGIFYLFNALVEKRKREFSLSEDYVSFAHLSNSIRLLENFLINEHINKKERAGVLLKKYIKSSFLFSSLKFDDETKIVYLPNLIEQLNKKIEWLEVTEKTLFIADTLSHFDLKIENRVKAMREIDLCVDLLKNLQCFEYLSLSKIKRSEQGFIYSKEDLNELLFYSVSKIAELEDSEIKSLENSNLSKNKLDKLFNVILMIFNGPWIFFNFIAWTLLFAAIIWPMVIVGIRRFAHLKMDSTLFIGALTLIVGSSITVSLALYSKRGKGKK